MSTSWGASNAFNIFRGSVTLELRTPNVTFAQTKTIFTILRRACNTEKKKLLTAADKQLLDIMQWLGGVPKDKYHGEYTEFFEKVRQEFNRWAAKHGHKQHKDWRATRNRHDRLLKRMRHGVPGAYEALF
jgi:hypothetical protein